MTTAGVLTSHAPRKSFLAADFFMIRIPCLPADTILGLHIASSEDAAPGPSWQARYEAELMRLYADPGVASAISAASPDLATGIARLSALAPADRERTLHSLARYVNRMSIRPTPFGLMASVGAGSFGPRLKRGELSGIAVRARPDMEWVTAVRKGWQTGGLLNSELKVRTSDLVYRVGELVVGDLTRVDTLGTPYIAFLRSRPADLAMDIAADMIDVGTLRKRLCAGLPGLDKATADLLICELARAGVLCVQTEVGLVAGQDPTLALLLASGFRAQQALREIDSAVATFNGTRRSDVATFMRSVKEYASEVLPPGYKGAIVHFDAVADWHREPVLPSPIKRLAEDATFILGRVGRCFDYPQRLRVYAGAFVERYGTSAEIPLLEVVSSVAGLGMPDFAGSPDRDNRPCDARRQLVLTRMVAAALHTRATEVEITETWLADLEAACDSHSGCKLAPASMDVYLRIIEPRGDAGRWHAVVTGAAPLGWTFGRFHHLLGPAVLGKLRELARAEEHIMCDTDIVELSYWPANGKAANVTVRDLVRRFECPVDLASYCSDSAVVPFADILVGVFEGIIYLRSASRRRFLSFTQSSMLDPSYAPDICRFLLDISISRARYATKFDWGTLRGLPFLPRLRWRDLVLSPATWYIRPSDLDDRDSDTNNVLGRLSSFVKSWRVPRHVYLADHSSFVLLDMHSPPCVAQVTRALGRCGSDGVRLEEVIPDPVPGLVRDRSGREYVSEIVVPVLCHQASRPTDRPLAKRNGHAAGRRLDPPERTMWPGEEWTSAEVAVPVALQDDVLLSEVATLLSRLRQDELIDQWFFVRYRAPEPHMRLRMHAKTAQPADLLGEIAAWSHDARKLGRIGEIRLVPYRREVDRYGGPDRISTAELLFWRDSEAVVKLVSLRAQGTVPFSRQAFAALSVEHAARAVVPGVGDRLRLAGLAVRSRAGDIEYRSIAERAWRGMRGELGVGPALAEVHAAWRWPGDRYARSMLQQERGGGRDVHDVAIGSMLHMHCNRLGLTRSEELAASSIWRHLLQRLKAQALPEDELYMSKEPVLGGRP